MKISIIILDYFKADRVIENVNSLKSQKGNFDMEIIIVDNSVDDDNAKKLRSLELLDNVRVIINKFNMGYSEGNNIGAKYALGDYILIINPDIICNSDFIIESLISFLEDNKDVGIIGPKQINDDGTIPSIARKFPNILVQIMRRTHLRYIPFLRNFVWNDEMRYKDLDLISDVDWIQSSFIIIRRSIWDRIKGFNNKYFIFVSDSEICYQCWKLGYRVIYYPIVTVISDGKRCSKGGFFDLFFNKVLRQHLMDSLKYFITHVFEDNPRKKYYLNKNHNLV